MDAIVKYITQFAQQVGASDPSIIVGIAILAFLFLTLIIFALRTTVRRNQESDRTTAILARVDELERNMQNFRAEMHKAVEQFRSITQQVREDMDRIRKGGGGGSEGGGSSMPPAGGGGPSGFGGGGGRRASSIAADFSPVQSERAIAKGMEKSRSSLLGKLKSFFGAKKHVDSASLDDLEELLISSDVGAKCAAALVEKVRERLQQGTVSEEGLRTLLRKEVLDSLVKVPFDHRMYEPQGSPMVVLVVGVNGVGKTTTVAKLAARWKAAGKNVVAVAADTFRAAAVEQLKEWGQRLDVPVIAGPEGAKPSTVVFDGMVAAKEKGADVVIIDTAGRLHTKSNLMQELEGVRNSIRKHVPDAPHETVLILDGVSGQNALAQAREFNSAVSLTGLVITKLDGTPKGGILVAVSRELEVPVYYVGVGEKPQDLVPFSPEQFVSALLDEDERGGAGAGGEGGAESSSELLACEMREFDQRYLM